ncbi:50S ribosomal protein L14 [Candidatus Woesearchaeota archaeon]|nr:50S ribosomal protein L14 [Candidatus Woesearchaeota archaeon]
MKALKSRITKGLNVGAIVDVCDNSGAKKVKIFGVKKSKTVKGRIPAAGVSDMVVVAVKKGKPDVRKQVFNGIVVRQKKEFRRSDGTRVKFEDNAVVILKDDKGTPKGTMFKGPIAKEVCERWPAISKLARIVV